MLSIPQWASAAIPSSPNFAPVVAYDVGTGANSGTVGDFNGDGLVDIATANRWARSVSILYGQPNGHFANRTDIAAGYRPENITSADFDHNGRTDIAVVNWGDNNFTLLMQQLNGTMSTGATYTTGAAPNGAIAKDLNQDGYPDIAVATSANTITVRYNDGSGGFNTRTDLPIDSVGLDLLSTDFNRDGVPDLATSLPNTGSMINVLYGRSTGGFANRTSLTFATDRPSFLTSADFNRDGIPDIAYSGYSSYGSMIVTLGLPQGGFQLKQTYDEPYDPQGIISGDFNEDGNPDIAAADGGTIWLYYGKGDGTFAPALDLEGGSSLEYLVAADLNGDGHKDILGISGGTSWGTAYVFLNAVPEPSSAILFVASGALSLVCRRNRRSRCDL